MTSVQVKTWMFFAKRHSQVLCRLSNNLLREICSYISDPCLPCIQENELKLHNLSTGRVTSVSLTRSFRLGCTFCLYRSDRVLCVGDTESSTTVLSLSLSSYQLQEFPSTHFTRSFSGVIAWHVDSIYVFGGNVSSPIKEVEKLLTSEDSWTPVPAMQYARIGFVPVRYRDKIILVSSSYGQLPVESFSPASETYEVLSITVQGHGNGALAAVIGDEILVILYKGTVLRLRPDQETCSTEQIQLSHDENAISAGIIINHSNSLYWAKYDSGDVFSFSLTTHLVSFVLTH